jgi:hypothetical protein
MSTLSAPRPQGSSVLTLTTNALAGDPMSMTEFSPAVPEPATWAMMGLGFAGLAFAGLHQRRTASAVG